MRSQLEDTEALVAEETAKLMSDTGMGMGPAERRLLAGMPLHAITSVHGEADLRERLLMEIAQFPAADRDRAADALALASRLHAADRRQREPYASHLLRVAIRILSHYRVRDADVACAALLHDAVEDHAAEIAPGGDRQAALALLAGRFGGRTAGLVAAVTNPGWEPGRDEHEQYRAHVLASLAASPWARVIKASDFTDNAVAIIILSRFSGVHHVGDGPLSRVVDTVIWGGCPRRTRGGITRVTCASLLVAAAFCSAPRTRLLGVDMSMTQNRRSQPDQAEC